MPSRIVFGTAARRDGVVVPGAKIQFKRKNTSNAPLLEVSANADGYFEEALEQNVAYVVYLYNSYWMSILVPIGEDPVNIVDIAQLTAEPGTPDYSAIVEYINTNPNLRGQQGEPGPVGAPGPVGGQGAQGPAGPGLEYEWRGAELGVRVKGETAFSYQDLQGTKGDKGDPGAVGKVSMGQSTQRPSTAGLVAGETLIHVNTEASPPVIEVFDVASGTWKQTSGFSSTSLAAPTALAARDTGAQTIALSWTPSQSTDVTGQRIEYHDGNGVWALLISFANNTTSAHTDTTVVVGTARTYRIRASSATLTSPWSNTATATAAAPAPAPTLSAPATYGDAIVDYPTYKNQLDASYVATPSFMKAYGFGANAIGFRTNPQIRFVTHLADTTDTASPDWNGSLRKALTTPGPAIVIPQVAGRIQVVAGIAVNTSIYFAGQAAPAPGITVTGVNVDAHLIRLINTSNVVIRFLRGLKGPGGGKDSFNVYRSSNWIVDHYTAGYGTDENIGIWNSNAGASENYTVQWSLASDPLNISTHPDGPHGKNSLVGDSVSKNVTLLGNFGSNAPDRGVHFIKVGGVIQVVGCYSMNVKNPMRISAEEATSALNTPKVDLLDCYFQLGDWLRNLGKYPERPVRIASDTVATTALPEVFHDNIKGYNTGNIKAGNPEGTTTGTGLIQPPAGYTYATTRFSSKFVPRYGPDQYRTYALDFAGSFRSPFENRIRLEALNDNGPDGRSDGFGMVYGPLEYAGANNIGDGGRETLAVYTPVAATKTWRPDGLTTEFATQQGLAAGAGLTQCPDGSGRLWVEVMLDQMALNLSPV